MSVHAREPFATEFYGYPKVIRPEDFYDENDPLVRAYPANFVGTQPTAGIAVEQASAAPGERRTTRRP